MIAGFSKDMLAKFSALIEKQTVKPNFILYNKMDLKTDGELTSSNIPAVTSEEEPLKPKKNKKKS